MKMIKKYVKVIKDSYKAFEYKYTVTDFTANNEEPVQPDFFKNSKVTSKYTGKDSEYRPITNWP